MVAILNNALIWTAKAQEPNLKPLMYKGMTFCFPPQYNPKLNRIEILWKKIKLE